MFKKIFDFILDWMFVLIFMIYASIVLAIYNTITFFVKIFKLK